MSIRIRLKSVRCVEEINESSGSEEPYVLVTSVRLNRTPVGIDGHTVRTFLYGAWEDVDEGEVVQVSDPPFWGINSNPDELSSPDDAIFIVSMMENDNGDPGTYRATVETLASLFLTQTSTQTDRALRATMLRDNIRSALNGIDIPIPFTLDDDHIGTEIFRLDSSDLISSGIKEKSLRIRSDEGDYDLGFEIGRIQWAHNVPSAGQVAVAPGTSPTSWYTTPENVQHIAYVGTDGLIHECFFFIGGDGIWRHNVPSAGEVAVRPGTSPTSWYTTPENVQHIAYVGTDGLIHECFFFIQ